MFHVAGYRGLNKYAGNGDPATCNLQPATDSLLKHFSVIW
jgi:hypothetical protein